MGQKKGQNIAEDNNLKLRIGNTVREYRKQAGMNQETLAEKLGITRESVARIENGMHFPSIPSLVKLAATFDVSTDSIVGVTNESKFKKILDSQVLYLNKNYPALSEEGRIQVDNFITKIFNDEKKEKA